MVERVHTQLEMTSATSMMICGSHLFRTERYDNSGSSDMTYTIPLQQQSGSFFVTLYFAEIYLGGANERVFDVTIQDIKRLENYDIVVEAGGPNKAVSETFEIFVAQGDDLDNQVFVQSRQRQD